MELSPKPVYEKLSAERLNTASRRIEIINDRWEKAGIASLKPYAAPVSEPGRYRLAIGGCAIHVEGHTINNRRLFSQMPENALWMHDATARDLGVSDGECVVVSGNGYSAAIKARVSQYMHPQAVFMVRGFGRISRPNPGPAAKGLRIFR